MEMDLLILLAGLVVLPADRLFAVTALDVAHCNETRNARESRENSAVGYQMLTEVRRAFMTQV